MVAAEGPSGGGSDSAPCPDGPDKSMSQHQGLHATPSAGAKGSIAQAEIGRGLTSCLPTALSAAEPGKWQGLEGSIAVCERMQAFWNCPGFSKLTKTASQCAGNAHPLVSNECLLRPTLLTVLRPGFLHRCLAALTAIVGP